MLQLRLAATGQYITYSPGPNSNPNVHRELERWLAVSPNLRRRFRLSSRLDPTGTLRRAEAAGLGEPRAARHP